MAGKPTKQTANEYPSPYETVTETYQNLPHEQNYYVEELGDQLDPNESSPSGVESTTYYVTEQPSDNEDIAETSQIQAFADGDNSNLEIVSIADDDPQYSTIITQVRTCAHHFISFVFNVKDPSRCYV